MQISCICNIFVLQPEHKFGCPSAVTLAVSINNILQSTGIFFLVEIMFTLFFLFSFVTIFPNIPQHVHEIALYLVILHTVYWK